MQLEGKVGCRELRGGGGRGLIVRGLFAILESD